VLHSPHDRGEGVAISLSADDAFALRVDAQANAISGSAHRAGTDELILRPDQPAWAARRPLRIRWRQADAQITIDASRAEA
jgi:hypothetical protein